MDDLPKQFMAASEWLHGMYIDAWHAQPVDAEKALRNLDYVIEFRSQAGGLFGHQPLLAFVVARSEPNVVHSFVDFNGQSRQFECAHAMAWELLYSLYTGVGGMLEWPLDGAHRGRLQPKLDQAEAALVRERLYVLGGEMESEHPNSEKCSVGHPRSIDVRDFCAKLAKDFPTGKPLIQSAREFTGGKESRSQSLVAQANKYRWLWDPNSRPNS